MKKILLSILLLLTSVGLARAEVVEIGSKEALSWNGPIRASWNYSLVQQIYTIAEIGTSGDIKSISYYAGTNADGLARKFDLYLVETEQEAFEGTTDPETSTTTYNWVSFEEKDKVFSGEVTFNANDWTTITLDEPFHYSGNKNLAVIVNAYTGSYSSAFQWAAFSTTQNQTLMARTDTEAYDVTDPTDWYKDGVEPSTQKTHMRFGMENVPRAGLPIDFTARYMLSQQIYMPDEVGPAGNYKALSFTTSPYADFVARERDIEVYVVPTPQGMFTTGKDWVEFSESDKVFSGKVNVGPGMTLTFPFNEPFYFDASGNLAVIVRDNTGVFLPYDAPFLSSAAPQTALVTSADIEPVDPATLGSITGTIKDFKANVTFEPADKWQIGEGEKQSQSLPTRIFYNYSISQQIYTADELGKDEAEITSLGFLHNGNAITRSIEIYLSEATKSAYAEEESWINVSPEDMVFSGSVNFAENAWTNIPLNKVFNYKKTRDGETQNLIVTVIDKTGTYQGNHSFAAFETAECQAISRMKDTKPAFSISETNNTDASYISRQMIKNQIRFNEKPVNIKPTGFRTADLDFKTATFAWNAPEGITLEQINLQYKLTTDDWTAATSVPITELTATSHELTGLTAKTDYNARLQFVYDGGKVSEPAELDFSTNIKPTSISFTDVTYQSATVTWESFGHTWDFNYKRHDAGADDWQGSMGLKTKSFKLTGLEQNTYYDVRVLVKGSGETSEWLTSSFYTLEQYPRPINLRCLRATSDLAVLSWDEEGTATAWQISLNGDYENLIDANTNRSFALKGLQPNTWYDFQVRAVYGNDIYSEWSGMEGFQTMNGMNPSPYIYASASGTSANVSWSGGNGESYDVLYRKVPIILSQGFEKLVPEGNHGFLPTGWTEIDADGDGQTWQSLGAKDFAHEGTGVAVSYSYNGGVLTPDNWLISPKVSLKGTLSVWLRGSHSTDYAEHFAIYVSTTGNTDTKDFTEVHSEAETINGYQEYTVDLSSFEGQEGYVAIRHFNCTDQYALVLDEFLIYDENDVDAGWETPVIGTLATNAKITGLDANTRYQVKVVSHMEGQPDAESSSVTFKTTANDGKPYDIATKAKPNSAYITWNGDSNDYQVFYRQAAYDIITEEEAQFFYEDFEGSMTGWTTNSLVAGSGLKDGSGLGGGKAFFFDDTTSPNQYIISPELTDIPEGAKLMFNYKSENVNYPETFEVGYSTTGNAVADFTFPKTVTSEKNKWQDFEMTLPAGVKYIAIGCTSNDQDGLYIDNVKIEGIKKITTPVAAGEWMMTEVTTDTEAEIEGLNPETKYDLYVRANPSSGSIDSDFTTFTTPGAAIDIELDNEDFETHVTQSTIFANNGAYSNVTIKNYTLKKDGKWQTICLPFDVDVEDSPLAGADVRTLDGIRTVEGDVCVLDFLAPVNRMKAGVPYIIRWTSGDDIAEPVFNGVILESGVSSVWKNINTGMYNVQVDYYSTSYYSGVWAYDPSDIYYMGEDQILSLYKENDSFRCFDCRFYVYYTWPAPMTFVVNTGDNQDVITGIASPAAEQGEQRIYNVAGQRLQKTQRGINIVGGKKVLVK